MKRKLDTRFPAARIKKIMQADEDIGKIAMAVPLLVSKALELFLQDLCDRTYEITTMKGAKTINSSHLKQCVQGFNVFDFLREIVGKVPDLGGLDAAAEDCHVPKKRKVADDDESKKSRMHESCHVTSSSRGRGRGRGRGQGRGRQTAGREIAAHCGKFKDDPDISYFEEKHDLSLERHVPDDATWMRMGTWSHPLLLLVQEQMTYLKNREEYPGWSLCEIEKMAIDPIKLADSNGGIDDEDYDEEV
ncbi:hypothetical protein CXB51_012807 [Gossypium anomalum]|uniref:Transcription factor CBF/NF-Y/archaeal histone domain-containing protein n=1 Tax=Gossypium anomalum TaxID=47600 RepID=A0A8J5ZGC7_9ROSI|nr:hypothetical protein CXB51_012807 [Gossypium anomalum]